MPLAPLIDASQAPVSWWFAFKFNAATDQSTAGTEPGHALFGGRPRPYPQGFCLQYASASSANPTLQYAGAGSDIGTTLSDPLGATFNQVYNGTCNYLLWNDQFYGSPIPSEDAPWGHSKGLLAWDDQGNGFVLQVSTPSWPASGSAAHPRANDGNTLGCIADDDVKVSQHFFCLALDSSDVLQVLQCLSNASVVTHDVPQLMNLGAACPAAIRSAVQALGRESDSSSVIDVTLSSGVRLISKPSHLHVPPWQMVSSRLGGTPLRVASWWTDPEIPSTPGGQVPGCWDASLTTPPGAVQIATTGTWNGRSIGLTGGDAPNCNHAKLGVSLDAGEMPQTPMGKGAPPMHMPPLGLNDPTVGRYVVRNDNPNWVANANEFWSGLSFLWFAQNFTNSQYYWGEPWMYTSSSNTFVNSVNVALTEGHGDWWLFSTLQNCCDLVDITALPAGFGSTTGGQMRFWTIHSCEVVPSPDDTPNWANPWWNVFQGLHTVVGYRTIMLIDDDVGAPYGINLALGMPVVNAWLSAVHASSAYSGNPTAQAHGGITRPEGRPTAIAACGHENDNIYNTTNIGPASCLRVFWYPD